MSTSTRKTRCDTTLLSNQTWQILCRRNTVFGTGRDGGAPVSSMAGYDVSIWLLEGPSSRSP